MKIKITKNYSQKQLFDNFELELQKEEIVCVLGCSGVGKTTLLNAFAGLLEFEGELLEVPKQVAFVFQTPRLLPHLTVTENLRYAFEDRVSDEKIERMLEKCRLTECKNRKARLLSGGEKKRVALARAFLSESELLLMDEPFSSLDTALKLALIELFAELWKERKKTVLFVTHDLEEALMVANKIVVLKENTQKREFTANRERFPNAYGENNPLRAELLAEILEDKRSNQ